MGYSLIHAKVFHAPEWDRECHSSTRCRKCRNISGHDSPVEFERVFPFDKKIERLKNDKLVQKDSGQNGENEQPQLRNDHGDVGNADNLAANQTCHPERRYPVGAFFVRLTIYGLIIHLKLCTHIMTPFTIVIMTSSTTRKPSMTGLDLFPIVPRIAPKIRAKVIIPRVFVPSLEKYTFLQK